MRTPTSAAAPLVAATPTLAAAYPAARSAACSAARLAACSAARSAVLSAALTLGLTPGLAPARADAQQLPLTECGALVHAGEAHGFVGLPQGDLFCPRVADPKELRTFASLLRGKAPGEADGIEPLLPFETTVGAIGVGDAIGLARWGGPRAGDGLQISIAASIFAQFDMEAESFDLINADYLVAVPVTLRRGGFSARLRVYHQSSHLGDEFLLNVEPERVNVAFESVELILSQAFGPLRVYAGGEHLFNRDPPDLEPRVAHGGVEFRSAPGRSATFVAALDAKATEQQDWQPAWSLRGGLEFGWARDPGHPPRRLQLLGEFYDGPSPYGQFYREQVRFIGIGLHLSR
jgi:hypothetical protein